MKKTKITKAKDKSQTTVLLSSLNFVCQSSQPPSGSIPKHTTLFDHMIGAQFVSHFLYFCERSQTDSQTGRRGSRGWQYNLPEAFYAHFYLMMVWNVFRDSSFAPEKLLVYMTWIWTWNTFSSWKMREVCPLCMKQAVMALNIKLVVSKS